MKILLVNPGSSFLINDMVFPSLGLLYLSGYLKHNGYSDIDLIDLNGAHEFPDVIDADVIGFYSNTPQFPSVNNLLKKIKEKNRNKKSLYVIGGPHVSGRPQEGADHFDYVVVGEGEEAMLDIVKSLENGKSLNSKIIKNNIIQDINSIPFPDRDLVDIKKYKYYMDGKPTTTLITSRGCPFGCIFCANNVWGKKIRMRDPENIYNEVKLIKEKYGFNSLMFFDDTMTLSKKRMIKICELLSPLDIAYRCFIRGDTVDESLLRKMKNSGCVEVGIGAESGSQYILDIARKGEKVTDIMRAIKLSKKVGLRVKGFFIIGLPGESEATVQETIDFLTDAELDDFDISIYSPYPGSIVYKNKADYDIHFRDDYEHSWYKGKKGHYHANISTSGLSPRKILEYRNNIEERFKNRAK